MLKLANKFLVVPLLLITIVGQMLAPLAQAQAFPDRYDMVAILVEESMYSDVRDYGGLAGTTTNPQIRSTTMKARVDRYAVNVQNALPGTRVVIIRVDRFDSPRDVAATLERLYIEGDPAEPNRTAYLKGVVLIGEVPLPVVNKEGNRFVSLFPYTDFVQKAYVWNPAKEDFELSGRTRNPQPEIWHGVIRPPLDTDLNQGMELLATYLDKNHLWHQDDPNFTTFDQKVFFQDFVQEEKNLSPDAYKNYLKFLDHWADISYVRYTKELYQDLIGDVQTDVDAQIAAVNNAAGNLAQLGIPVEGAEPIPGAPPPPQGAAANQQIDAGAIPDIQTKIAKMSDNLMPRFYQLFTKYPNLINDFIRYTGRYSPSGGVDSAINLITQKDQYSMEYLRSVNDMIEAQVDSLVPQLEQPIVLWKEASIEVDRAFNRADGSDFTSGLGGALVNKNEIEFYNHGANFGDFSCLPIPSSPRAILLCPLVLALGLPTVERLAAINGVRHEDITSVEQCTPYRGTLPRFNTDGSRATYGKLVELNHSFNPNSAVETNPPDDGTSQFQCSTLDPNETEDCNGWDHRAGCFYTPPPYDQRNPQQNWCFPEFATNPIIDPAGAVAVQSADFGYDDFRSCYQFYEQDQFEDHQDDVEDFLDDLEDDEAGNGLSATQVRLQRNRADYPALDVPSPHPDQILIVNDTVDDDFDVTLGHLLRALGFDTGSNGNWQSALDDLLRNDRAPARQTVQFPPNVHRFVSGVTFDLQRDAGDDPNTISSAVFHKEPTNETLNAQVQALITPDLPVDDPRYVTFQDRAGNVVRIDYPDLYEFETLDDYVQALVAIEQQINGLPGANNACNGCLTGLVSNLPEQAAGTGAQFRVTRANRAKILDAIRWQTMDLDAKHSYMNEYYLDARRTPYVGGAQNGYEFAYLNGGGEYDAFQFTFTPIFDESGEALDPNANLGGTVVEEEEDLDALFGVEGRGPSTRAGGGYDLISFSPPPLSPWWERMKEWMENLQNTTFAVSFGEPASQFNAALEDESAEALAAIQAETLAVEGDPARADDIDLDVIKALAFEIDSNVVTAGRRVDLVLRLLDADGALVNDEAAKLTLILEGPARFSESLRDDSSSREGLQITMLGGTKTIGIVTSENPGAITLRAELDDSEVAASVEFRSEEGATLAVESAVTGIVADGTRSVDVEIVARDQSGRVIEGANGVARVALSDMELGVLSSEQVVLTRGRGTVRFTPNTRAGRIVLAATSATLEPGALTIDLLPGPPTRVALSAESTTLITEPGERLEITAMLFDAFGNIVDTNSAAQINFEISPQTAEYGSLAATQAQVARGVASVTLLPRNESGFVDIRASAQGLQPGILRVNTQRRLSANTVAQMDVDALAVALLGIPAGDVTEQNFLGGWFLNRGRVQSVTTLTTAPKLYKKLIEVQGNGGVVLPEPDRIRARFVPNPNFTMVFRDQELGVDLAEVKMIPVRDGQFTVLQGEVNPDRLQDGIYLHKLSDDSKYVVDRARGALRLVSDENEALEVQTNGFTRIFDNDFSIRPVEGKFLTLQILDKNTPVAEVLFIQRFNQAVFVQDGDDAAANVTAPGIYVQPFRRLPQILSQSTFTGNSSESPKGVAVYDRSEIVAGGSAPGFAFTSLEDSLDTPGVGFTYDNKFMLQFAAGEMIGAANQDYASDIGIVLGDPTISLDNSDPQEGFANDLGQLLYAAGEPVREVLPLDYNVDGFEDLLVLHGEGRVRLIQNNGGYDQMRDQGFLLDIKNGIQDMDSLDFNNDGRMDLVVAGKISCRVGDTCLDVYENTGGSFTRRNLRFRETAKVVTLGVEDINADGFMDIVFADTAGDIKVIYNQGGTFPEGEPDIIGNIGLQVDPANNLIQSVLLRYAGMPQKIPNNGQDATRFRTFSVQEPNFDAAREAQNITRQLGGRAGSAPSEVPIREVNRDFIYADLDAPTFSQSTKFAQDLNGGIVAPNDRIRYTITLRNRSAQARTLSVSDAISTQIDLDRRSIACRDCAEGQLQVEEFNTSDPSRSIVFNGMVIPAGGERTLVYEGIFRGDSQSAEPVTLIFSRNFEDPDPVVQARLNADRALPDIGVTKASNPTGQIRYFAASGLDASGRAVWSSTLSSPPSATPPAPVPGLMTPADVAATVGNVPLDAAGNPTAPPPGATAILQDLQTSDTDGDGLQDIIDDVNGGLDAIESGVQGLVDSLSCDAGCIALPVNAAFLSPGPFSFLGAPVGFDPGLPVFGWGVPSIIPVWPPSPYFGALGGRLYVSPSLTGGIGFGLCLGPYGLPKNCFSFGVNPLDLLDLSAVCESINGAISAGLSVVNNVVSDLNEGLTLSLDGGGNTAGGGRNQSGSGLVNYSLGSYEAPTGASRNTSIPGFPSIITDWLRDQINEIISKLTDVPDVYLIYPEPDSIVGAFTPGEFEDTGDFMTSILSYLNSIPLLDIQTQPVNIKVPVMTRKEVERWKADARQWIEDEKKIIEDFLNAFCIPGAVESVGEAVDFDLCNIISVDLGGLITSVEQNMRALDEWILFPKKINQYRQIEAYYMGQIIDYLDTIIEFTGGWVQRNTARVKGWRRAVRQIKDVLENWKILVDIMIDFNETCDKCKTERFSLTELIAKLFIVIPRPPIIPMPKLPDFIIDVSKVRAGLTVQWPDVQFTPAPITLPPLPRFGIDPNITLPQLQFAAPRIPVIPSPPNLPTLPELPQLNLPQLPDLPPPPTLPELPGEFTAVIDVLQQILRIYCIIKLGFLPTDEFLLKTKIEEITARGLTPLIPLDLLIQIEPPTINIDYVDAVKITGYTNLELDFSGVQDAVEAAAQEINNASDGISKGLNKATKDLSKALNSITNPKINIGPDGVSVNDRDLLNALPEDLSEQEKLHALLLSTEYVKRVAAMQQSLETYERQLAALPETVKLEAASVPYVPGEHQPFITDSDIILPFQKRLKEYRDRLAQHIDATEEMSERNIANSELGEIGRFLAQQRSPFVHESLRNFVAGTELKPRDYDGAPVKVGELDFEAVEWVDESDPDFTSLWPQENEAARRIAQVPQPPDYSQFQAQAPGGGSDTGSGNIRNIGIFTVDNSGQSRRIVSYTLEAESQSVLADIDLDNDGDNDKVYTYGPNVYLKRNDRVQAQPARAAFRPEDIEFWRLAELVPAGMSPNFPEVNNELVHEASFSFDLAPMDDVVGYEVVSQNSASTIRTFLVPEESAPAAIESDRIRVEEPDGEVLANNAAITENVVRIGDFVATGNNSSVRLVAADGTTLRLAENTGVSLDPTGIFELRTGSLEIDMPPEGSALFPAGTKMQALAGSIRIRFFDGSTVVVEANRSVTLPDFSRVAARVERASGTATITSAEREIIRSSRDAVRVKAGEVIHALQVARVQWNIGAPGESEFTLSPDVALPVPDALGEGIDIRVESGSIEVIRSEQREQEIQPGMLIDFGDRIQVGRGSARLQLVQTGPVQLGRNETFVLQKMPQNNERPSVTLQLDPAFYQSQLFAFDAEGNRSTGSEPLLLSPQVCGDTSAPFANLGKARFTVAVGKTLPLDASRSFDGQSNIISYWLDTDATVDSDGDGTANNDRNAGRDTNTAVDSDEDGNPANDFDDADFTIGPFAQVGTRNMRLTVRDEALNEGYQDIIVDVVEPRIVLNPEPLKSNIISGFIEPAEEDAPISIFRLRSGENSPGWELLTTPSANENSQYLTDEEGRFSLQDLDQRDRLVVRDQQGEDIAEINRETGRIVILNPEYEARVLPAGVQTRIGIFRISDILDTQPVTFVYFVPDVNLDVILDAPETVYDLETVRDFVGVHMRELPALAAAGLRTRILPGDDPEVPGAGVVLSGTERLVTVDINGDIRLHSSDLTLTERPGGFYEPVVFELRYLNELIAEVYIATTRNFRRLIEIVDAPAIVQTPTAVVRRGQATGSGTASGGVRRGDAGFSDVQRSDPLFPILNRLKRRGIVAGVGSSSSTRGELFYEPDRLINRAEFTQVTEKALCIVPRPEAFELPSPFFDVINEDLWFYPVLKEGNIRGFIRGYIGEARTESDGRTTTPFRPANPITRAEAATIVLAALQEQNIIDFSNVSLAFGENENWYDPFIRVALDLEPYLIDEADSATRAFLITPEEAQRAEEQITRRDFAVMVDRVLLLYDCYDNDSDNDGLPDRWELEHGVDDPNADPDGDQCTNQREFELDTNPNNPDTDGGGTPDCREDETGTNPLSPYDDFDGLDGGREDGADNAGDIFAPERIGDSDPGVFVVRPPCTQCPCQATIAPGEDLQPSDIIFAGLTGPNGLPIYTKSNEERY